MSFLWLEKPITIFHESFFSTNRLIRNYTWKCIWFPIVSSMHIHHIGVFIFIKLKDMVALITGYMGSPIAQFHQMRTVQSPIQCSFKTWAKHLSLKKMKEVKGQFSVFFVGVSWVKSLITCCVWDCCLFWLWGTELWVHKRSLVTYRHPGV